MDASGNISLSLLARGVTFEPNVAVVALLRNSSPCFGERVHLPPFTADWGLVFARVEPSVRGCVFRLESDSLTCLKAVRTRDLFPLSLRESASLRVSGLRKPGCRLPQIVGNHWHFSGECMSLYLRHS